MSSTGTPGPSLTHVTWLSGPGPITFVVVVLNRQDPALGSTGTVKNEFPIQGLDGESVQHSDVDLLCEGRCRGVAEGNGLGAVGLPFGGL